MRNAQTKVAHGYKVLGKETESDKVWHTLRHKGIIESHATDDVGDYCIVVQYISSKGLEQILSDDAKKQYGVLGYAVEYIRAARSELADREILNKTMLELP